MRRTDEFMLHLASRHALRAAGRVEPNPLVGCVIARRRPGAPVDALDDPGAWEMLGVGHHRVFGGVHAEVEAIRACAANGHDPRGATAWVTLEPCDHTGKTGPCTRALLEAGLTEVVFALRDPNPISAGGAEALRRAGLLVRESRASEAAAALSAPFVAGLTSTRPWVIAKWAQTPEGSLIPAQGAPRWISGRASRARVHRLRGRVDAILTGIGTALADDPLLTARLIGGRTPRRTPLRIVVDSRLRLPMDSALVRSARDVPLLVACAPGALEARAEHAAGLRRAGVRIEACATGAAGRIDLGAQLARLRTLGLSTLLLEAGPTLLRAAFEEGVIDEAWVFIGGGAGAARDETRRAGVLGAPALRDSTWRLLLHKRSGEDGLAIWRRE